MILQVLVGLGAHIHIEPEDLLVISTQDEVVTLRVQRNRRNPLGARLVLVDHGLLLEVVLEDSLVSGDKEVRLCWVELHGLHDTLSLSEGSL